MFFFQWYGLILDVSEDDFHLSIKTRLIILSPYRDTKIHFHSHFKILNAEEEIGRRRGGGVVLNVVEVYSPLLL